jgi:hypothetical protein
MKRSLIILSAVVLLAVGATVAVAAAEGDDPSPAGGLETVADLLGMDLSELREALGDGAIVGDLAAENGVDPATIVDALTDEARARIEAWVNGDADSFMPHERLRGFMGPEGFQDELRERLPRFMGELPEDLGDLPEEMRLRLEEFLGGDLSESLDELLEEWDGEMPEGFFGHRFGGEGLPEDFPEEMRQHVEEFLGSLPDTLGGFLEEWDGDFPGLDELPEGMQDHLEGLIDGDFPETLREFFEGFEWDGEFSGEGFFFGPHGFHHPPLPGIGESAPAADTSA